VVADLDFTLYIGKAEQVLRGLPDSVAQACVTSPPYLDARPEYPSPTLEGFEVIFRELRRVVRGAALVNVGRLWRGGLEQRWWLDLLASAESAGWGHVDTRIWVKPNANPIHGAAFADSHEYVLVLGEPSVRLNTDAIRTAYADSSIGRMGRTWRNGRGVKGDVRPDQKGRALNPKGARPRSFVAIHVGREKGNEHPAPMPLELAQELVAFGSWPGDTVIDPFAGSGTTALAARRLGRKSIGIEQDARFAAGCARRLQQLELAAA
jgi:DNA modification methylase